MTKHRIALITAIWGMPRLSAGAARAWFAGQAYLAQFIAP
jgi:hypothetical protein